MKALNFFKIFPKIELGDVNLRELRLDDTADYYQYLNDDLVKQYLADEDIPKDHTHAKRCVQMWSSLFYNKYGVFWAVVDAKNDQLIGTIGYTNWNYSSRRAEISYDISSKYWNKGIGTKILTNVINIGMNKLDLYRIEARVMMGNKVSQHLLNKMKFKEEGILRGYRIIYGIPEDIKLFSLIRPEYVNLLYNS
jgi:ribosomal-protein-alanine N-acetyltransferase